MKEEYEKQLKQLRLKIYFLIKLNISLTEKNKKLKSDLKIYYKLRELLNKIIVLEK